MKIFPIKSHLLLFLAFLEGGTVMTVELLGARMIAPLYGSVLEVWTVVLAVSIGALAIGYKTGGNLSLRIKNKTFFLSFIFLCASVLVIFMPYLATFFVNDYNVDRIIFDTLFISLLFLFPPLFLLGSTSPLIIDLLSKEGSKSGWVSGNIYGVSTLGGVFFTYAVGFYLIPSFGLSFTAALLGLLMGFIPFFLLIKNKNYFSLIFPFAFILFFLSKPKVKSSEDVEVVHFSDGLLGQLLVVDIPGNFSKGNELERVLFVNRMGQTWINKRNKNSHWSYTNYIVAAASTLKQSPDVLLLGLGGGTVSKLLQEHLNAKVDAVELDQRIADIARIDFDLKGTNIFIDDARHYIETTNKKYDLIVFDVFKGEVPPSHALSLEAFVKTKDLLRDEGLIFINFNGFINGEEGKAGRSLLKTLEEAGFYVNILPTLDPEKYRNILYIASLKKHDLSSSRIHLNIDNKQVNINSLLINRSQVSLEDAVVLRDDKPILEKLNSSASKSWRADYYQNYTKKLKEKGIPIFE